MSSPFLAEIRIFPFNFAPSRWAFCAGQVIPITQNTSLFSLLGTTYGGNGTSNFGLPNLLGNVPLNVGQGPGLSQYVLGETAGSTTVTLPLDQIPMHNHTLVGGDVLATSASPAGGYYGIGVWSDGTNHVVNSYSASTPDTLLRPDAVGLTGNSQAHNNMMPYLTLNFCIALQGVYPARN
jgi:microcystin-dependent protein